MTEERVRLGEEMVDRIVKKGVCYGMGYYKGGDERVG